MNKEYKKFIIKVIKIKESALIAFKGGLSSLGAKQHQTSQRLIATKNNAVKQFQSLLLVLNNYKDERYGSFEKFKALALKDLIRIKNDNIKAYKNGLDTIHNLREKIVLVILGAFLSITFTTVANEAANPFNPIFETTSGSSATEYIEDDTGVHPLQQYQVKSYTLVALISSKKAKIAMVKVKSGQEYFVRMNDLLGSSSGRVTGFTKNGLEITQKDEVITLAVRNKGSK